MKASRSPLLISTLILSLIGLFFISISSLPEASAKFNSPYYFFTKQLLWFLIGLIFFFVASKIKLSFIKKISLPAYLGSLFLLLITLIPQIGHQALGARRWLDFGTIGIQPSEILKLATVLHFSSLFSQPQNLTIKKLTLHLTPALILIIAQPNLSTAILVFLIAISIFYLANGPLTSLFTLSCLSLALALLLIFLSPYRLTRFKTLINPQDDQPASYHHHQIVYALASGGLFGKGFGSSNQKYRFIPKISTDSILAVIGEETGLIGLIFIFYLYFILSRHLLRLSAATPNQFHRLILGGIASWIACQSLINAGAIVAIIPITGVPLPFISYGGSSLISLFTAIGLAHNIQKHHPPA